MRAPALFLLCALLLGPGRAPLAAQASGAADSTLAAVQARLEQIGKGGETFGYQADTLLLYGSQADSILLEGHAAVDHKGARLEASQILLRRGQDEVEARPEQDSSGAWTGLPVLRRGEEVLQGRRILYDLKAGQGTVLDGRIRYQKGFYAGELIQTRSASEFLVRRGSYTTCDLPDPHFDFYSPRIKVLAGDMAIARPVYFRVEKHRLFWIPFFVFSLRQDRQSGLLTPQFGRRPISFGSQQSEWELSNLGYYFAPSDYWDLTLAADQRQRSGWLTRARLAYAWRYHLSGGVETRLENRQDIQGSHWEWWTSISHNQELSPTASLRASGTFQSNKDFSRDNSTDLEDRLNRTLRSNLNFTKRWRRSGHSLSLSASQTRNLDNGRFDLVLPEANLHLARKPLWGGPSRESDAGPRPWYSQIYYESSGRLGYARHGTQTDTTSATSAELNLGLSAQPKPFSWLYLNPTLTSTWADPDLGGGGPAAQGVRTDRLSATAALTQTFYGQFYPHLGRLTALRHVLKPSLSASYQAARADTGSALGFGGRSGSWQQNRQLDLRLDNTFWVKVQRGEEESKVRLAQLNLSTAYNLDRKNQPLSPLTTSLAIAAGHHLDTRLSLRSGFYDAASRFRAWPRLEQFEVSSTLGFSGSSGQDSTGHDLAGTTQDETSAYSSAARQPDFGYEGGLQQDLGRQPDRQNVQLSHYYSRTRTSVSASTRSWLRAAVDLNWRRRWSLHYSFNYDLRAPGQPLFAAARVTAELLSMQRSFHDWVAVFSIQPSRFQRDHAFYFKAQFRDIPQLKFERGDSRP